MRYTDDPYCEWCLAEAVGELRAIFKHKPDVDIFDMIELYTGAVDAIYVEERKNEMKKERSEAR